MPNDSTLILPWDLGVGNMIQAVPALRALNTKFNMINILTQPNKSPWWQESIKCLLRGIIGFDSVGIYHANNALPEFEESAVFSTFWQSKFLHQFALIRDIPWFYRDTRGHVLESEYFNEAARLLGFKVTELHKIPYLNRLDRKAVLVVNSGATDTYKFKKYPHFTKIVEQLELMYIPIATAGDPKHLTTKARFDFAGVSLDRAIHAIHLHCGFAITNDCLWSHVAASLLNLPTIVLYGPTRASKNLPWGKHVKAFSSERCPSHPCEYTTTISRCPHKECFVDITPDLVMSTFVAILEEYKHE